MQGIVQHNLYGIELGTMPNVGVLCLESRRRFQPWRLIARLIDKKKAKNGCESSIFSIDFNHQSWC